LAGDDGEHGRLEPDLREFRCRCDTRSYGRRPITDGHIEIQWKLQAGCQNDAFEQGRRRAERIAGPESNRRGVGLEPHDVRAFAECDTEVLTLPDGEADHPSMSTDRPALFVHDRSWSHATSGAAPDELVVAPARHETELLALALVRAEEP